MKTYTGKEYMQIDIASNFGLDKLQFEDRIEWVNQHENELESLGDEAAEEGDFFKYAAAVLAYRKAQRGEPTGHIVGLDACASGPSLLSCLTGCAVGAANTGLTGKLRVDTYGIAAEHMEATLGRAIDCTRHDVKYSFMPFFFGSIAEPERLLGEDSPELSAFHITTKVVCPGASMILPVILNLWDEDRLSYQWDLPDGFVVNCMAKKTVDDTIEVDTLEGHPTFKYRHKINTYLEQGEKGSKCLVAGVTHGTDGYIVRELTARCDYDIGQLRSAEISLVQRLKKDIDVQPESYLYIEKMYRKHSVMSIEGVEFVNYWSVNQMSEEYCTELLKLVRTTLKRPSFKVLSNHDFFGCLPNYLNWVRQTYIEVVAEVADSTMLDAMLSDIAGYTIRIEKLSIGLGDLIRDGEYAIA